MSIKRMTRINELLRREIAEALYRLINEADFDFSAVTVTRVETSSNLRFAKVMVSIRDHHMDRDGMMATLRAKRKEIQQLINKDLTMKYTPQLAFELDESIERGDHVLQIISEMEQKYGIPPDSTESTGGAAS
jgi:ribosome-binding factor A